VLEPKGRSAKGSRPARHERHPSARGLRRLEQEGLIIIKPHIGAAVRGADRGLRENLLIAASSALAASSPHR
jgi:hypothetical protein